MPELETRKQIILVSIHKKILEKKNGKKIFKKKRKKRKQKAT